MATKKPTTTKTTTKKPASRTKKAATKKTVARKRFDIRNVKNIKPVRRLRALRAARAHKSFALTRRRDIPKPAKLPGYVVFTVSVARSLWQFRRTFFALLSVYVLISIVLIGVSQQEEYRTLTDALGDVSKDTSLDSLTQVGGLFGATLLGSLNSSLTEVQQFYLVGVYVFTWLVVVWLLRQLTAGNRVRVRDGLYSAGAPLLSSALIVSLMGLQIVPGALGVLLFAFAIQSGAIAGVIAMLFGVMAILLVVLSLYWLTSSLFALVIVTLPGTYPMTAIRGASEIALGKRAQLLRRLLWLVLVIALIWVVVLFPAIMVDIWVKVSWLPLVTIAVQVATGLSLIYGASYVFLLYRRMIDGPAK